ncbi:MAG: pirin family protein [Ignavibacteria bacterium]|jgi:redox-sensitive bicupin YhaK (pirin superfamily)
MKSLLFPAQLRGHFSFGWLDTYHTFSFGEYYDPSRMNFGALRVFNDDTVAPGAGFGTHPHRNMEIISIPTSGVIMHEDSMGHAVGIAAGDVQVMSAGTGITHSEYNGSSTDNLTFFQIWIVPDQANVTPRYDQVSIGTIAPNSITCVVGPKDGDSPLWIHQQAWLEMGHLGPQGKLQYARKRESNGVFVYITSGEATVEASGSSEHLDARDAIGIMDEHEITISSRHGAHFMIIDVPLA